MSITAAALRELHRIHRQLSDLRDRLERGPRQIRAREGSVAAAEGVLAKAKADQKSARMGSDQKQLSLKSSEGKIEDWRKQLNVCKNNREYQALLEQIAAAEMAKSVLEDEILESLDGIAALGNAIAAAEEKLAQAKTELAATKAQVDQERAIIEGDVARLEAELSKAETAIPADFRGDYERVVRAKGSDALAEVHGDACGGCYQQLTPNMLATLSMGRPVFCRSCGRLLYLPEDRVRQR